MLSHIPNKNKALVIPAKAGIQSKSTLWIPAFAGMTNVFCNFNSFRAECGEDAVIAGGLDKMVTGMHSHAGAWERGNKALNSWSNSYQPVT